MSLVCCYLLSIFVLVAPIGGAAFSGLMGSVSISTASFTHFDHSLLQINPSFTKSLINVGHLISVIRSVSNDNLPDRHLLVERQRWKHQKNVNSKLAIKTSDRRLTSFWCPHVLNRFQTFVLMFILFFLSK